MSPAKRRPDLPPIPQEELDPTQVDQPQPDNEHDDRTTVDEKPDETVVESIEELPDDDLETEDLTQIESEESLERLDDSDIVEEVEPAEEDEKTTLRLSDDDLEVPGEEQTQSAPPPIPPSAAKGPRVSLEPLRKLSQEIKAGAFDNDDESRPTLIAGPEHAEDETLVRGSEADIPVVAERPDDDRVIPQTLVQDLPEDSRTLIDQKPEVQQTPVQERPAVPETRTSAAELPPVGERSAPETRASAAELPPVGSRADSSPDSRKAGNELVVDIDIDEMKREKELAEARHTFTSILEKSLTKIQNHKENPNKEKSTVNRSRGQLARGLAKFLEEHPLARHLIEDQLQLVDRVGGGGKKLENPPPLYTAEGKRLTEMAGMKLFEKDPFAFAEKFGYGHNSFTPRKRRIEFSEQLISSDPNPVEKARDLMERKVLLPDEMAGVLYTLEGQQKEQLAKTINEAKEDSTFWETKETLEFVRRSEELHEKLSATVQLELPYLTLFGEANDDRREKLSDKIVETKKAGSGVNSPYFARTKNGTWGVYKPRLQEQGNFNGEGLGGLHYRISLRPGETAGAETVTPIIGFLCGMGNILATPFVNGPVGPGTMQMAVIGEAGAKNNEWFYGQSISPNFLESGENVACLDSLSHNSDRHPSNFLIDKKNTEVLPNDHGLTMVENNAPLEEVSDQVADRLGRYDLIGKKLQDMDGADRKTLERAHAIMSKECDTMSVVLSFFEGRPLSADLHKRLSVLLPLLKNEQSQVHQALLEILQHHFKEKKGQRLFDRLVTDLEQMVTSRKFPKNGLAYKTFMGDKFNRRIQKQLRQAEGEKTDAGPTSQAAEPTPSPESNPLPKKKGPPPLPKKRAA